MRKIFNNVFEGMDKFWHGVLSISIVISILLASITCADEYYIGKSKEELTKEMFEVDSLIKTIELQLDSTSVDFKRIYINAQRINNGHE
jgi:hypothetical protein|tara:strand:+ start:185 stop:451 length:267 start_codon:yes stop_codon:yes gene_type:complete